MNKLALLAVSTLRRKERATVKKLYETHEAHRLLNRLVRDTPGLLAKEDLRSERLMLWATARTYGAALRQIWDALAVKEAA